MTKFAQRKAVIVKKAKAELSFQGIHNSLGHNVQYQGYVKT